MSDTVHNPNATSPQASATIACPSCGLNVAATDSVCPRDGTAINSPPPTNLNFSAHYELLGTVGTGGMSVVYKARQTLLNKFVAVKMLHLHLLNDQAIMRF